MAVKHFEWYTGEDLSLGIRIPAGAADANTPITVIGKKVETLGAPPPLATVQPAFTMSATFVASDTDGKTRWRLVGAAEDVPTELGPYVLLARIGAPGARTVLPPMPLLIKSGGF